MTDGRSDGTPDEQPQDDFGAVPPPLPSFQPPPLPPPLPPAMPPPLPDEAVSGALPPYAPAEETEHGMVSDSSEPMANAAPGPLPPMPSNTDTLGIASLITALLSLPIATCCAFLCFPVGLVGFVGALTGGVLGIMGMRKAKAEDRSSLLSLIGLCLSIFIGVILLLYMGLILIGFATGGLS